MPRDQSTLYTRKEAEHPCFGCQAALHGNQTPASRQGLAAAPQPLVEEEDDGVDGRFDRCHPAAGEQLATQQVATPKPPRSGPQGEAGSWPGLWFRLEFVPAKVVEVEGDRVHGGLMRAIRLAVAVRGQRVNHGEGDKSLQDGEADGSFVRGGVSSLAMKAVSPESHQMKPFSSIGEIENAYRPGGTTRLGVAQERNSAPECAFCHEKEAFMTINSNLFVLQRC